ncbi:MAG: hypothetical protein JXA69_13420 [Phycisphaerae bacterium]|nr:hypothetical protein [Phycisphaerae bacterium]
MAIVKIKAAEEALEAGRLDEAYEQIGTGEIREHRRAQAILTRLATAYLDRVREHEAAGRFADALRDLDRAAAAGAPAGQVGDLRIWIQGLAAQERKVQLDQQQIIRDARQRIEAGSLEGGREMLADLDAANTQVDRLHRDADERERAAERYLGEARRLFEAGQVAGACRAIERAKAHHPKGDSVVRAEAEMVRELMQRVREAMTSGRLTTAVDLMVQVGGVGSGLMERSEWEQALVEARGAVEAVARGDWSVARRAVLRLKGRLPEASWIAAAAEQLDQMEELCMTIHAGPLGTTLPADTGVRTAEAIPLGPRGAMPPVAAPPIVGAASGGRWRLLVDGAGSFLVLRQDRVVIGRAGSGEALADIALMADVSSRHAEILRVDEDYFLFARKPLRVNGRGVERRLLEDGDRIELSPRARLTFRLPSKRSASAVLDLGGSLRLSGDVRRVILLNRHATLGPGDENHIVVPGARDVVGLIDRSGSLQVRAAAGRATESRGGRDVVVGGAEPVELAGMRIVAKRESA